MTTVKVHGVFPSSHKESRIFTGNSNSLSQHWRQRGSRYAIHAGRNLPAKEFRYLRTVRVTAAVYQGLDSGRWPVFLAFWHRAGLGPYTSSFDLAESCVFIKQSLPPIICYHFFWRGPPYPEVTESFCRVPSILFSHTFLQCCYLIRLSILYLSTCFGIRYGLFQSYTFLAPPYILINPTFQIN